MSPEAEELLKLLKLLDVPQRIIETGLLLVSHDNAVEVRMKNESVYITRRTYSCARCGAIRLVRNSDQWAYHGRTRRDVRSWQYARTDLGTHLLNHPDRIDEYIAAHRDQEGFVNDVLMNKWASEEPRPNQEDRSASISITSSSGN